MNSAPPKGDFEKAEKYINQLVSLIEQNKIEALHTDLQKFDPSSIQDHYRIDLKDYQIEISHSKLPNSGADSFVMLFTNLKNVESGESDKVILAYLQLSDQQFHKFKTAAQSQIQEKQRLIEEKRFKEALNPIDDLLAGAAQKTHSVLEQSVATYQQPTAESSQPVESTPKEINPPVEEKTEEHLLPPGEPISSNSDGDHFSFSKPASKDNDDDLSVSSSSNPYF